MFFVASVGSGERTVPSLRGMVEEASQRGIAPHRLRAQHVAKRHLGRPDVKGSSPVTSRTSIATIPRQACECPYDAVTNG